MAASTSILQSAVSPDGSVVAIVAPSASSASSRHVIQIYQVSDTSTSLQLTLTHTSSSSRPLTQLVFVGKSLVLGRLGRSEVVVWDLHRGVVAAKLTASDEQSFLALASNAASDDHYYILVRYGPKLLIHEYQAASQKLIRKIKSGHVHGDEEEDGEDADAAAAASSKSTLASMIVTPSHFAVRTTDSGIRIMAHDTGKKIGKIKIKSLNGAEAALDMAVCQRDSNVVATIQDAGNATTVLYNMSSCKEIGRIAPKKVSSNDQELCHLQLTSQSSNRYTLLHNNALFSVDGSGSSHDLVTHFSSDNAVALFLRSSTVLALMYRRGAECQARWVSYGEDVASSLPAIFQLDQEEREKDDNMTHAGTKKRKPTETAVLGPGQAGAETASSVKKIRVIQDEDDAQDLGDSEKGNDDDDDENDDAHNMTIADRLAMLKEALDEDAEGVDDDDDEEEDVDFVASDKTTFKFKPKTATTESLKELLSQALQSSDDNLLELALMVRDANIIATTLKEMDGELLVILLGKLTSRLASSPLRAESLSVWISHCLKRGTFHPEHLAVLRNLLYERIESFSDLLRLEGRLSMMVD